VQRSIATTLPTVAASRPKEGEAMALPVRRSAPRWLLVGGFWTLIVLAYSTRGEVRVGPYQWVSLSWFDAPPPSGMCGASCPWPSTGSIASFPSRRMRC